MKFFETKFVLPSLLLVHVILLGVTTFTLWPEMVVYPYLVNNGFLLYRDLINPYPPFFTLFLATFTHFFGSSLLNFRVLTLALILLIDVLVYTLSLKIHKKRNIAGFNLTAFIILSLPFGINGLWFDLVQTPFILLALYSFQKSKYLFSAIFLTIAVSIKQQALWILPFLLISLFVLNRQNPKKFLINFCVLLVPLICGFLLSLLYVENLGVFQDFIKWAVILPLFKASTLPGYVLLPNIRQLINLGSLFGLFILAPIKGDSKTRFYILGAAVLTLFAYPRFDYFHLIPALSVLALYFSVIFNTSKRKFGYSLLLLIPLIMFGIRFFQGNLNFKTRFFEKDILIAAENLKRQTAPEDTLYMQNAPDQLLALCDRLPIKPWADEFPWYLEYNNLQQNILDSIKYNQPKYIVFQSYQDGAAYSLGVYRPKEVVSYLNQKYEFSSKLNDNLWLKKLKI